MLGMVGVSGVGRVHGLGGVGRVGEEAGERVHGVLGVAGGVDVVVVRGLEGRVLDEAGALDRHGEHVVDGDGRVRRRTALAATKRALVLATRETGAARRIRVRGDVAPPVLRLAALACVRLEDLDEVGVVRIAVLSPVSMVWLETGASKGGGAEDYGDDGRCGRGMDEGSRRCGVWSGDVS